MFNLAPKGLSPGGGRGRFSLRSLQNKKSKSYDFDWTVTRCFEVLNNNLFYISDQAA